MKIVFIQHNPGARTVRIARALADNQQKVSLITRAQPRFFEDAFDSVRYWSNPEELTRLVNDEVWADVWHIGQDIHCEWMAAVCSLFRRGDARIVYDVRDMRSLIPRRTLSDRDEVLMEDLVPFPEISAFRVADGVIHVSEECRTAAYMIHKDHPQSLVLYSAVMKSEWPDDLGGERSGIVYSGALSEPHSGFFRDYGNLFSFLVEAGRGGEVPFKEVHVYPANAGDHPETQSIVDAYTMRGCRVHPRVPDLSLVRELAGYQWGIVGFQDSWGLGQCAMPNKLFEYIAAGVVPVVVNCRAASRYVGENKIGLTVNHPSQLKDVFARADYPQMVRNIKKIRKKLTQDYQVSRLLPFYRAVMNKEKRIPGGFYMTNNGRVSVYDPHADPSIWTITP